MSNLKRLIIHHTGGGWIPNNTDLQHYHFLISGSGKVKLGLFKPEDNINCYDGKYAEHTGGMNTGSISLSFCANEGFSSKFKQSQFPIRKEQFEHGMELAAQVCKKYSIPIQKIDFRKEDSGISTHYEVGKYSETLKNPVLLRQNFGKVDIMYLPFEPSLEPNEIIDFIVNKIKWYYNNLK